ncbi:replication protein [Enterobacteriaceae bacterium H4N4]|uniref:Replication protein n=2 Tax=Silvania confinis TaxID=2926470 RepID=A0A9J6QBQ2_9ENTR|nr:replication protein [Silvania confinis]MCU6669951.1 replication protein [Silvania confinis]
MADLSNGYTRIANEIQKLKPRLRMSGREWQCLEAVIWLTYGWNKKQDRVTNTVISGLTGLADSHVSDAISALAERGIIFSHKQGVMKIVGINTDLSAWILDKPKTGKVFPETGKVFPKSGKTFPETVDTQDYNKNNIKRSSSENSVESSDDRLKKFLSAHPEAVIYTPNFTKWGTVADQQCAEWIILLLEKVKPFPKKPNLTAWANDVRLMRELDGHSHRDICELFQWASKDAFWHANILSPAKLRAKWDTLSLRRDAGGCRAAAGNAHGIDFNNTDWINEVFDGKTI